MVAADHRAAQGRAQRALDHDRRPGLRRARYLRRRDPDAGAGPDREQRAALHAVQLHRALLAHAGRAHHRPQPPLVGLRRDHRAVHGLPGLRLGHGPLRRDRRQDPQGQRLRHVVVRQEPQHAGLPVHACGPVRSMAVGDGLRILLRLHGRRDRPVDAVPVPEQQADLSVAREARVQPHDRHGGRGDLLPEGAQCRGAREAVLPLLRARRKPLAAPADEGVDREVQGQVRHGLERPARADLRQPEEAGRHSRECEADGMAG